MCFLYYVAFGEAQCHADARRVTPNQIAPLLPFSICPAQHLQCGWNLQFSSFIVTKAEKRNLWRTKSLNQNSKVFYYYINVFQKAFKKLFDVFFYLGSWWWVQHSVGGLRRAGWCRRWCCSHHIPGTRQTLLGAQGDEECRGEGQGGQHRGGEGGGIPGGLQAKGIAPCENQAEGGWDCRSQDGNEDYPAGFILGSLILYHEAEDWYVNGKGLVW